MILLVHKEELKILFNDLGEETLKELISSGRVELKFRNNFIGSVKAPNGKYGVSTFKGENMTAHSVLYNIGRQNSKNSIKNLNFADEYAELIPNYNYPDDFSKVIVDGFQDVNLLKRKVKTYFSDIAPFYTLPHNIDISIIRNGNFI